MTDKFTQVPQNIVDATELFDNWLSGIISEFFVISEKASHAREYEILQYRYGLNGRTILTLEETGIIFDVTRERIRQIEKKATESLSELINDGASKNRKLALNPNLHSKLMQFKENLKQIDQIVSEDSIVSYTTEYFSEANIDLPLLRLLLTLFGFKAIRLETGLPDYRIAWALEDINTNRIENAIQAIFEYLRDAAISKTFNDLKLAINKKKNIKSRFSDQELKLAIDLAFDIERLEDDTF